MDIVAKETKYNGRLYRSRLEARWAVVFDALKISFEYEPVRFESEPGMLDKVYTYLPDFYFPEYDVYGEVKPTKEKLFEEQKRIGWTLDCDFTELCSNNGLLLLGQIPFTNLMTYGYVVCGNRLYHDEGIVLGGFILSLNKIEFVWTCRDSSGIWEELPGKSDVNFWFDAVSGPEKIINGQSDLHRALLLGRSARFDFDDSIPKMLKERRTVIGGGVRMDNRPGAASQKTLDDLKRFIGDGK